MTKYSVDYAFGPAGGGYFYNSSSNMMTFDSGHSVTLCALDFAHELNHAKYFHEHKSADIMTSSRKDYVQKKVEEEAEGTVKSIEEKIELEGTTINVSGTSFPLETQYRQAYKAAVDAATRKDPKLPPDKAQSIGRAAGTARVVAGFMKGEVTVSIPPNPTYPTYYGNAWDRAHPKKP
jgi:hypothetical protein